MKYATIYASFILKPGPHDKRDATIGIIEAIRPGSRAPHPETGPNLQPQPQTLAPG